MTSLARLNETIRERFPISGGLSFSFPWADAIDFGFVRAAFRVRLRDPDPVARHDGRRLQTTP